MPTAFKYQYSSSKYYEDILLINGSARGVEFDRDYSSGDWKMSMKAPTDPLGIEESEVRKFLNVQSETAFICNQTSNIGDIILLRATPLVGRRNNN